MTIGLCASRKFRLVKPGVMAHWCQGCCTEHSVDLSELDDDGRRIGWNGSFDQPSFGGPLRHDTEYGPCAYELRGGELHFADDCWHPLAGKVCHLENLP